MAILALKQVEINT